jgi:sugar-specific transcriptional regulator TrmB
LKVQEYNRKQKKLVYKKVDFLNNAELNNLLANLGLTEYESKTLSTLFELSEAEAPEISRMAQVPKTRVYDVLEKLIARQLVIEIRGRPKKYRVIDAQQVLDALVLERKTGLSELESQVTEMKSNLANPQKSKIESKTESVIKVKDKHDFERILAQELEKAEDTITGFTEISDKHTVLKDALEKAKEKNVAIKLLNSFSNESLKKSIKELKHAEHGLNAFIIDDKKVILALSDFKKEKPEYHFTIWHENKPMANAFKHYFDKVWAQEKN